MRDPVSKSEVQNDRERERPDVTSDLHTDTCMQKGSKQGKWKKELCQEEHTHRWQRLAGEG